MISIRFEWDENKNLSNQDKHKISFEEAQTVFYDFEALVIDDPEHSEEEERFIILGLSKTANLLVVCHCYRETETVIRIISARKATKTESKYYTKWGEIMREEYNFSNGKKNPYAKRLKKQITINIDSDTIDYFKGQSENIGIPYQTLMNLYLSDCASNNKQVQTIWQ